jgi:hypothetical protein
MRAGWLDGGMGANVHIVGEVLAGPVPAGRTHNLPAGLTSFLGRASESARLEAMLARHRLVTVTGPGGSGKTRIAIEVARALVPRFGDGVSSVMWGAGLLADAAIRVVMSYTLPVLVVPALGGACGR